MRLPGAVNGWRVAEEFRFAYPLRAVIFANAPSVDESRLAPSNLFFPKPYRPADVIAAQGRLNQDHADARLPLHSTLADSFLPQRNRSAAAMVDLMFERETRRGGVRKGVLTIAPSGGDGGKANGPVRLRGGEEHGGGEGVEWGGVIIAFPDRAYRPTRAAPRPGEPGGEILLFTGVRYERSEPSPGPSRPFASEGRGRRRRS